MARHESSYHIPGPVANGGSGARGAPTWEVLRFDGAALNIELLDNWVEVMLADVDGDGTLEVLVGYVSHVYCYHCGMTARSFSLHRAETASRWRRRCWNRYPPGRRPRRQ